MAGDTRLHAVDKIEIVTLQDNYIDLTATDNNEIITRAGAVRDGEIKKSVLAEHGFSVLLTTTRGDRVRTMLFDFGFSDIGAAYNARALNLDLGRIEALALSHGHSDHTGGFQKVMEAVGKNDVEFAVHPAAFRTPRYLKFGKDRRVSFPPFGRELCRAAGARLVETREPYPLLDGHVLFLGEIVRRTDFEQGFPLAYYDDGGIERKDPIEDDTSIAVHLKDKGLVIISGCAHSGIVNTVYHAQEVTGVQTVHAIVGGFHLSGPLFEPIIEITASALAETSPSYVVPCHCTGRKAIAFMEALMPYQFIMNMSGTRLTFSS
jgi:7,8-dihydropterin-6-yl-methyl-4-(beta-D-ribofuranosyl)aminobenzene 5'-phosphate synthase